MARDFKKLLEAIRAAGAPDATPTGAVALLSKALEEINTNEQCFSESELKDLVQAHREALAAATAGFQRRCVNA